ncbi:plasmid replication protein, CyRepA1 family [Mesorhizobium sp. L2C084A000]|uniref:plasmid replication protein, CyRepA1 family n=1 Tax=Mesorhizobium sp. L2C084A000 TaxID=1287116 RepID=UPI0003D03E5D|nr:plasmid replication protein, CyRepA1 family [Mesorhizobium sp. L2C084A000]ESZ20040.1 hypothetical protein X734_31805 [Mesorhizobium sp. L2C084A000]
MEIYEEATAQDQAVGPDNPLAISIPPAGVSWLTRRLRLSINRRLIDKNSLNDDGAFTNGFEPLQLDVKALLGNILCGYAYCAELRGPRSTSNFKASDILSIDIDDGMTLDEAVEDPFFAAYATFIYTTASHTEANHRFRIGFALERTIEDAKEMRAATRSLILKFSSDGSASDPARIFFGNRKAELLYFDRGIPAAVLDDLIAQGTGAGQSDNEFDRLASTRSKLAIFNNQIIMNSKGISGVLDDFKRSEALFCPFHKDRHPSAFVIQNQQGQKGIRCSACVQSFWSTGYNDQYDFYSFEKAANATNQIKIPPADIDHFFPSQDAAECLSAAAITFIERERLESVPFLAGATFVRSPKGSGKTHMLANLVQEEQGRFLLIGHRRTLIRSMCTWLGLNCYLDDEDEQPGGRQDRYGICLDSLMKIKTNKPYDYILIDESEQVLAHFLSSTMKEKRLPVLRRLMHLVSDAKRVVALDADLSWNTFRRICEWRKKPDQVGENHLIINTFRKERGTIHMVPTKTQLVGEIHQAIAAGKRCFVTANNKGFVEKLEKSILEKYPEIRLVTVTSTSVQKADDRIQSFVADPKLESTKYQIVLASPSLGTGVDFSFEDESDRFDIVFGMFDPLVLTHFDCDQQLARVRSPKAVRVFVSPAKFSFETDLDTVTADALSFEMMGHLIKGYNSQGRVEYQDHRDNDPLLRIAASVLSVERASKNDLRNHFVKYVQSQGWDVVNVERNDALYEEGSLAWVAGSELYKEQAVRRLLEARSLAEDEFDQVKAAIKDDDPVDDAMRASYSRSIIERFYRQELTDELIKLDDNGKMRKRVRLFEQLIDKKLLEIRLMVATEWLSGDNRTAVLLPNHTQKEMMALGILAETPFYSVGGFHLDVECGSYQLTDFVAYMQKHAQAFETQFDKPVRADLEEKPMSQLKSILKMVGLSTYKSRTISADGEKTYLYKIDPDSFAKMNGIADSRRALQ